MWHTNVTAHAEMHPAGQSCEADAATTFRKLNVILLEAVSDSTSLLYRVRLWRGSSRISTLEMRTKFRRSEELLLQKTQSCTALELALEEARLARDKVQAELTEEMKMKQAYKRKPARESLREKACETPSHAQHSKMPCPMPCHAVAPIHAQ